MCTSGQVLAPRGLQSRNRNKVSIEEGEGNGSGVKGIFAGVKYFCG